MLYPAELRRAHRPDQLFPVAGLCVAEGEGEVQKKALPRWATTESPCKRVGCIVGSLCDVRACGPNEKRKLRRSGAQAYGPHRVRVWRDEILLRDRRHQRARCLLLCGEICRERGTTRRRCEREVARDALSAKKRPGGLTVGEEGRLQAGSRVARFVEGSVVVEIIGSEALEHDHRIRIDFAERLALSALTMRHYLLLCIEDFSFDPLRAPSVGFEPQSALEMREVLMRDTTG
uniref:Uncharacterized protein n=1 Tax=Parascaris univalens TaxID=6257 RepID=A0A915CI66_PARUN